MTMAYTIHGDASRFAVQWELNDDPAGHYLLGKMCFWVGNKRVGNYELGTALSDVLVNLTYLVGDCGNRRADQHCHLTSEDTFSLLQRGLFDPEPSLSHVVEEGSWARFNISLPVDIFDGWRLYLIDCELRSRLLVGHWSEESDEFVFLMEGSLPIGEFDRVIIEFQRELEATWEDIRSRSQGST